MTTQCPTEISRRSLIEEFTAYARECGASPVELLKTTRAFCNTADAPVATKSSTDELFRLCRKISMMTRGGGKIYTFYTVAFRQHSDICCADFAA
ncbi:MULTISPECIES: hypothetical protein [unclassified Sulfitobacter]|uniref:hypothetical protein n=1 Tax=unclassified Sulfitobacter TaxID=196795 RepID=UPI0004E3DD2F|nr:MULTISPECIES: hypothetical protein [unclassified Sulfitobacter]PTA98886.1 hypothetical protein C8254_10470 [Sulfitobacter sp. CB-A]ULO18996.1 hypothetical protein IV89_001987 [Sulfitobacter sp. CB2047]